MVCGDLVYVELREREGLRCRVIRGRRRCTCSERRARSLHQRVGREGAGKRAPGWAQPGSGLCRATGAEGAGGHGAAGALRSVGTAPLPVNAQARLFSLLMVNQILPSSQVLFALMREIIIGSSLFGFLF